MTPSFRGFGGQQTLKKAGDPLGGSARIHRTLAKKPPVVGIVHRLHQVRQKFVREILPDQSQFLAAPEQLQ
jgi:hypothetical protein